MSTTTAATTTALLPFQPDAMTAAQLAAVSYLARYAGHTHQLYAAALRQWFGWCQTNDLDPLAGIQRAHIELYIRHLHESGPRDSSVNTMMHAVRGFFRFAHIDGLITADPADRLAATVEAWWQAIEAGIVTGYSNARSKGYNRLARHEGRNAFGFRNPVNQRRRIRWTCTRQHRRVTAMITELPAQVR